MIQVRNLRFSYPDDRGRGYIFDDFSFSVKRGESWCIIGSSGCGKTTLLLLIAGLNKPEGGNISIASETIHRPRPKTGLILQNHGLLPWATIYENTRLGHKIRKFYGPDGKHSPEDRDFDEDRIEERVQYWLKWLGIAQFQEKYPAQLSRGQNQRAAIARTLVLEPDLLLMDEPFSALDAPIREELQRVMNTFHRESGLTSITVTHDIEEAVILGEKILVLNDRCNSSPVIVDNHLFGSLERRDDPEFIKQCQAVKSKLKQFDSIKKDVSGEKLV